MDGDRPTMNLLLIEEDGALRDRWTENLRRSGHRIFAFSEAAAALETARTTSFDVGVISFSDPVASAELQSRLKARNPACQITLLSPRPQEEQHALALEAGARSVLLKPLQPGALEQLIERAAHSQKKKNARPPDDSALKAIIGESPVMTHVLSVIRKVASVSETAVFITGESGTGKELVARAIHGSSSRAGGAFLEVNCAAIPEHLLESELFGHEKGAFTDASRMKPGLFELADKGTIFLDEIGEMSLELQAKLLRVLDTRSIRRIAGQEKIDLDVRILAATNRDLLEEVRAGRFRNDLYHRLNVVGIHVPPLRERGEDIRLLADHFVGRFSRKFGREGVSLDETVLAGFDEYPWPGNVRELMNQIERAILLSKGNNLGPGDFPLLGGAIPTGAIQVVATPLRISVDFSAGPVALEDVEREVITQALETAGWNISEAARLLNLGRGALRYKISQHGIERDLRAA
jgi:two-component system response regulator AtoC